MAEHITVTVKGLDRLVVTFGALARAGFAGGARVGSTLGYARFVHDGSRPHLIRPRQAQALSWPGAAHPVRVVHHPGYAGNPYLTDALAAKEGEIRALLGERIVAAADGVGTFAGAYAAAGLLVESAAKARVNVRTGALRRDIHTEVFGRG